MGRAPRKQGQQTERGLNRRALLVGGGATAGLLLAWAVWPRAYRPNLNTAPGETAFNAFLKIDRAGQVIVIVPQTEVGQGVSTRSEEHTSELQSLMRISYAVFCLKKKKT